MVNFEHCIISGSYLHSSFIFIIFYFNRKIPYCFRPSATNGLWCSALLPTVLVLNSIQFEVSELYSLLAFISVGLLCYCILFIIFLSISCLVLKEHIYGGCEASTLTATLLLYGFQEHGNFIITICNFCGNLQIIYEIMCSKKISICFFTYLFIYFQISFSLSFTPQPLCIHSVHS